MTHHGPKVSTNTVVVVMGYASTEGSMENVYNVHKASAWSLTEVEDLVAGFAEWEAAHAKSQRAVALSLIRITATDITSLNGARVDDQLASPISGTAIGQLMPANVTFGVKGDIGKRGRGRQGRTFWIGLTDVMVLEDMILKDNAIAIVTALNALRDQVPISVPGAELGVIHQFIGGVWQADAPFDPILDWVFTDLVLDSQRDRLPGHKRRKIKPVA